MRHLPKKQSRRLRIAGGTVALALVGMTVAACEHADALKQIQKDAEDAKTDPDNQPKDPIRRDGEPAKDVLKTSADAVTGDAPDEPVVDDDNRMSCGATQIRDEWLPSKELKDEAREILARMDIHQKVVQLTGIEAPNYSDSNRYEDIQRSRDDEQANIRGYQWRDGPHGVNLESGQGRKSLQNHATSFPTSVAQGATFDMDLVYRVGEAIADETVASGNNVLLGPCMNVLRHPYWGRSQETFGEDTYHLGRIGTAFSLGLQEFISGCAKHYTANNIENQRFSINSQMDEQTLREVYGRHFEMVVRDGGVGCMMASYNQVNGKKSTQNKHTLTEMLREDMGFQGFVLTDWWAMPGQNTGQGPIDAPQDRITTAEALEAGLDVEVPWAINFDAIPDLVADGTLDVKVVDRAVLRVLEQKLRFNSAYLDQTDGLKTPTTRYDTATGSVRDTEEHAQLAEEMAEKAMVLLKNDGGALPFGDGISKVAVIGATVDYYVRSDNPPQKKFNFVTDPALGDRGSSRVSTDPALTAGPLDGIRAAAPSGVEIVFGDSAAAVGDADAVIVIAGLTAGDEGEEYTGASDRESLSLGAIHNNLINDVADLNKPTVVVIEAGGVVDMPWLNSVEAVVMAWYPGQRGGAAMGNLIFGEANFAGRLPVTWPASIDQFPVFNEGNTTQMDYFVGYRRFDQLDLTPLYAFGHGLSYSTFEYERLHMPCGEVDHEGVFNVEVDVRNTSGPAGDEVIMVFASYPETQVRRSKKELKAFARVNLQAGEAKRVQIPVRVEDLKYWDRNEDKWAVEEGPVLIQVGPSSDRLLLEQTIVVNK